MILDTGPGGADEHRGALGAGEDFERVVLLGGEWSADTLRYLTGRMFACELTDVSPGGLGELGDAAFDRLLLRANREGRHPATLQRQHPPVTDHPSGDRERLSGCQLAGGLLKHDRA
jgi:hypothetical protein